MVTLLEIGLGYSVDLNDDGQILVVGAPRNNDKGVVRVYQWQESNTDWDAVGTRHDWRKYWRRLWVFM
jgi:hypothetical protein